MRDFLGVKVVEGRKQLMHNIGSYILTQVLLIDNVLKQLTTLAVLQHQKADLIPLPYLVQLYDIWMVQCLKYFHFIHKCLQIF